MVRKGTPDPKTCLEARTADPSLESGMFWIDPDGQSRGDDLEEETIMSIAT